MSWRHLSISRTSQLLLTLCHLSISAIAQLLLLTIFLPHLLDPIFCGPYIFVPNFFKPTFFRTQNFFRPKTFLASNFIGPKKISKQTFFQIPSLIDNACILGLRNWRQVNQCSENKIGDFCHFSCFRRRNIDIK